MKFKTLVTLLPIALAGCVSMNVTKAPPITGKTICIVNNPEVWTDFRDAYERQIVARGYSTKIVDAVTACDITSTYSATLGFHWGSYLATAKLTIYDKGTEIGKAEYKAPYASPEKHGRFEGKIETLVSKLLP